MRKFLCILFAVLAVGCGPSGNVTSRPVPAKVASHEEHHPRDSWSVYAYFDAQKELAAELTEDYRRLSLAKQGPERNRSWSTDYCPVFFEKSKRAAMKLTQTDDPRSALEALLRGVCMSRDAATAENISRRYEGWNGTNAVFLPYVSGGRVDLITALALAIAYDRNAEIVEGTYFADPQWNAADYADPHERENAAPLFLRSPFYVPDAVERPKLVFNVVSGYGFNTALPMLVIYSYGDDRARDFLLEAALTFNRATSFYTGSDRAIEFLLLFPPSEVFRQTIRERYAAARDRLIRERGEEVAFLFDAAGALADSKAVEQALKELPRETVRKINTRDGRLPQFVDASIGVHNYMNRSDFREIYRFGKIGKRLESDAAIPEAERERFTVFRREFGINRALRGGGYFSENYPENFAFIRQGDEKFEFYFSPEYSYVGRPRPLLIGSDPRRFDEAYCESWIAALENEAKNPGYSECQQSVIASRLKWLKNALRDYRARSGEIAAEPPVEGKTLAAFAGEYRAMDRDLTALHERLQDDARFGTRKVDWPKEYYAPLFERAKTAVRRITGKNDLRDAYESLLRMSARSPLRIEQAQFEQVPSEWVHYANHHNVDLCGAIDSAMMFERNAEIVAGTRYAAPDWMRTARPGMGGYGGAMGGTAADEKTVPPPELAYHCILPPAAVVHSYRDERARELLLELTLSSRFFSETRQTDTYQSWPLYYLTLFPDAPELRARIAALYDEEKTRLRRENEEEFNRLLDEKGEINLGKVPRNYGGIGFGEVLKKYERFIRFGAALRLLEPAVAIPEADRERFSNIRRDVAIAWALTPKGTRNPPTARVRIRKGEERFQKYLKPFAAGLMNAVLVVEEAESP